MFADIRQPEGHQNPQPRYSSTEFDTDSARIGAVALPRYLIIQLNEFSPLAGPDLTPPDGFSAYGQYIQSGAPGAPQIGDERVSFQVVKETDVTALAEQSGATLKPFRTSQGTDIFAAYAGRLSKEQVFDREQTKAGILTWIFRGLAFGMMYFGLMLMLNPLAVLADVIPFIGSIVGGGVALFSFILSIPVWFLTTAFAWMAYRPLLSIGLAVGGLLFSAIVMAIRKPGRRKAEPAA